MLRPPGPLCDRPNMVIVVRNVAKDVDQARRGMPRKAGRTEPSGPIP